MQSVMFLGCFDQKLSKKNLGGGGSARYIYIYIYLCVCTKLSDSGKNSNISVSGYVFHHQPTKLFCSGSAICVNDKLDHFPGNDLTTCQKEFETICIAIKLNRNKNILCCCVYRHPNTNQDKFLQFLDSFMQKMANGKKDFYIMGDFNFDLLNYANDNDIFKFLNSFVENGLLPLIHQPTRITESTGTVTDNIFCNNFDHETISGNLPMKILDHLPHIAIVKNQLNVIKQLSL